LATGPDGVKVTTADILEDAKLRIPEEARGAILSRPASVAQLASTIAMRRELVRQAESMKLEDDPVIAYQLRLARERVLAEARIAKSVGEPVEPAVLEKLALSEYRANPDKFTKQEAVRARHILIDARACDAEKQINELLRRARNGEDFTALAKEFSHDKANADRGGDLGFFERGRKDKVFENAAFALQKPGDVSDVVRSQFGLHIIKLEEKRAAAPIPFETVREKLIEEIAAREANRRRSQATETLAAGVKVDETAVETFVKEQR
jgi:peptidyl-prolyl cis-trans isomerase C